MLIYFFRFSKWIIPLYIIFLFACSVGFQTCLRFNSHLNSWTLTFWRSILQLIIGLLGLCFTSQSFIGPPGSRFKLFCHVRIKSSIYVVIGFLSKQSSVQNILFYSLRFFNSQVGIKSESIILSKTPYFSKYPERQSRSPRLNSHSIIVVSGEWVGQRMVYKIVIKGHF